MGKDNCKKWGIAIILVVLICATIIYYKMPKKVCHKEYFTEVVDVSCGVIKSFPYNAEYMCEEGINVKEYSIKQGNKIYGCAKEGICIIKNHKKVCEIKYS